MKSLFHKNGHLSVSPSRGVGGDVCGGFGGDVCGGFGGDVCGGVCGGFGGGVCGDVCGGVCGGFGGGVCGGAELGWAARTAAFSSARMVASMTAGPATARCSLRPAMGSPPAEPEARYVQSYCRELNYAR